MASPNMSLKLLVDTKAQRVLFAEAPKEFVDFLFHIFSLPLGTLIQYIGSEQMVGCSGLLKYSIESLQQNYLQPGVKVDDIFNPKTAFNSNTFLLSYGASSEDQSGEPKVLYRCPKVNVSKRRFYGENSAEYCSLEVALYKNSICPYCSGSMCVEMNLIKQKEGSGYVKEVVTYMVMDDLVVKPMSSISSITLINNFCVKDLSQLEEKIVSFGKEEGLKLLMASLKTDKVLSTIFMT